MVLPKQTGRYKKHQCEAMLQGLRYFRKGAIMVFKNGRLLSLLMYCSAEKHWLGYQKIQILVLDVLCV